MSEKLNNIIDLTESKEDKEYHQETKVMDGPTFDTYFQHSYDDYVPDNTIDDSGNSLMIIYDKAKNKHKLNLGNLSTTYQSPRKKLRMKNKGKTKHIQEVIQPKLERNIDAEIMIKRKAEIFYI